jgi:hypothetical protein
MASYITEHKEAVLEAMVTDLNVASGIMLPEVCTDPWPEVYKGLWELLIANYIQLDGKDYRLFRILVGLPRGHAKTTFFKLFTAFGLAIGLFNFPLVVCATDAAAINFIVDVSSILNSTNMVQLFGNWQNCLLVDKAEMKRANYQGRNCILAAYSVFGSIRGINVDFRRPDAILVDDAQTKEIAKSKAKSSSLKATLFGTVFKAKDPKRCGICVLGNRFEANCLVTDLADSGQFVSLITSAILHDGKALFPELHSLQSLKEEFVADLKNGQANVFAAEVLNQPIAGPESIRLLPDGQLPLTLDPPLVNKAEWPGFITIDPADKKRHSDDNALAVHKINPDTLTYELVDLVHGRFSPLETITEAVQLGVKHRCFMVFVESVAYQATLAFWANRVMEEWGMQHLFAFVELSIGRESKLGRIRNWIKEVISGQYVITNEQARAEIVLQALQYDVNITNNADDLLDSAAMGVLVRNAHQFAVLQHAAIVNPTTEVAPIPQVISTGVLHQLTK